MIRATNQRAMITRTVLLRLNIRQNAMGFHIADAHCSNSKNRSSDCNTYDASEVIVKTCSSQP
ncbi:hypothetical protein K0M31_016005 [Melipona bicolor]|uniref:Uncharacterized protein n=1 Tax=Melipona bicolor TaxID=60889 RepID=A0AA40G658_9HYME|nr:hypothetical protein K0M31_016005 [Melipona bicolor]